MLYITHINKDNTYSVKDSDTNTTLHFTYNELINSQRPTLGVIRTYNNVTVKVVNPNELSLPLEKLINKIQSPDLRYFCNLVRRLIPPYFFTEPASSTGKYHPACDAGEGGLLRHTECVVNMLLHVTSIKSTWQVHQLDQRKIDMMIVACIFHDSLKSGWQEDWEDNKYTKHEHPLLAANLIRGQIGFLDGQTLEFIAHCIETHMGQWTTSTYSKFTLPEIADNYQYLVHLADYLASRSDIETVLNNTLYVKNEYKVVNPLNNSVVKDTVQPKPKTSITQEDITL